MPERRRVSDISRADMERKLAIDEHDLEAERRTQHDKFYVVARQLALAISLRDEAKKDIKELEARLSEEVRNGWDDQQDGRLTEKICADRVLLHPDMIDHQEELKKAELQVGLWWALKDAYEQRNDALKDLIRMYLSEHYGELQLNQAERHVEAEQARAEMRRQRRDYRERSR